MEHQSRPARADWPTAKRATSSKESFSMRSKIALFATWGFWDKFFDSKRWRKEQKAILKGMMAAYDGKRWTGFPTTPDEKPVWDWFRSLEERFLVDAPYKLHTTRTASQFKERKGQMDIFFQTPFTKADGDFRYKHVLVVGEQKKS
ncbi:hypothetical protein HIM_11939 [Hirsutella minnesotensis 3608]|uniref:Uncharacterized protein n=1 Tax=Hirsutella minnesotensis 3608 TaxID=1043627 RepID=A0A0F7ZWB2_9HYPO|nr:hypothetical protein HIM_11939 [Hirsutella minnesotensis 3608]